MNKKELAIHYLNYLSSHLNEVNKKYINILIETLKNKNGGLDKSWDLHIDECYKKVRYFFQKDVYSFDEYVGRQGKLDRFLGKIDRIV